MRIVKNYDNELETIDSNDHRYYDERYKLSNEDLIEIVLHLQNQFKNLQTLINLYIHDTTAKEKKTSKRKLR